MSGLAGLLAGHHEPGAWAWHAAFGVDDVRHAVEHAGWRFGHVDGWTHPGKQGFLEAVGEALAFPAYYGRNLDALHDCLRDVAVPTVLLWDGWGPLAREEPGAFGAVLSVLRERAAVRPGFAVLLRGEGPPVDVPALDG